MQEKGKGGRGGPPRSWWQGARSSTEEKLDSQTTQKGRISGLQDERTKTLEELNNEVGQRNVDMQRIDKNIGGIEKHQRIVAKRDGTQSHDDRISPTWILGHVILGGWKHSTAATS